VVPVPLVHGQALAHEVTLPLLVGPQLLIKKQHKLATTVKFVNNNSVSNPDPNWTQIHSSVDPDSESRSGSRMAKMKYKNRKKLRNFMF
jgi:hypothetical protein